MKLMIARPDKVQPKPESAGPSGRRGLRPLVISLLIVVILVAIGGGYLLLRPRVQPLSLPALPAHLGLADLGLQDAQDYQRPLPANPLTDAALPSVPSSDKNLALLQDAAGQELIRQGQVERGLAYLRAAAQATPENLRINNDYRMALRHLGRYKDEEAFFAQQVQQFPSANTQIALALSYVDQMRACPRPPDGLVCQAQNSSRSINVLTELLEKHPYNIIARDARGLNHLYWPSLMGHLPKAQDDLQYAVALLPSLGSLNSAFPEQAYTALGDVFAKDGQVDKARNVWLNGKLVIRNSLLLDSRIGIPQNQLVDNENTSLRGLGVFVETDLAIFWQGGRS